MKKLYYILAILILSIITGSCEKVPSTEGSCEKAPSTDHYCTAKPDVKEAYIDYQAQSIDITLQKEPQPGRDNIRVFLTYRDAQTGDPIANNPMTGEYLCKGYGFEFPFDEEIEWFRVVHTEECKFRVDITENDTEYIRSIVLNYCWMGCAKTRIIQYPKGYTPTEE